MTYLWIIIGVFMVIAGYFAYKDETRHPPGEFKDDHDSTQ